MEFLKRAWAEIHLDRLKANVENYKKHLSPNTDIMCVVKADSYGHDSEICSEYLQNTVGIKWFAVSNLEEAIELRESGINSEILILGYTPPEYANVIAHNNIIQTITEFDYACQLSKSANSKIRVHIKMDTGMTRLGLRHQHPQEYVDEIKSISQIENIQVEGIFTHLSVADSTSPEDISYTKSQQALFDDIKARLVAEQLDIKQFHSLNSAGGIFHYDKESTLARLGIMLYGLNPDSRLIPPYQLHPVMDIKAVVSQVKTIEAGVCVSYGRTFVTKAETKLATVAIGYADGIPRSLSNKGQVLINGNRANIVGTVCMDQLMIDVTGLDTKAGDTVTLIGLDGSECITADDIADICGTIGYEIVCGITKRVPRIIYKNGEILCVRKALY
ncbi:MAG: alanine racemase [Clostridiales bacterium]|nr:alanine racemase [Clostridiales bacterium]